VILAGGQGTRLRPYTTVIPKPLMPVGDQPLMEIILRQLCRQGFRRVTVATGHLAQLIETFFGNGDTHGLEIDYFREQHPLGTIGALGLIPDIDDDVLVMNGDILTDLDMAAMYEEHRRSGASATIATSHREVEISLGVLQCEAATAPTRVTGFLEKPRLPYEASMGVYCFARRALERIEPGEHLDFPELILRLIGAGEVVRTWRSDSYWLDIGRFEDYEQAMEEFDLVRARLLGEES
jgi:NDP-sugar pyrophosphorylase family protein